MDVQDLYRLCYYVAFAAGIVGGCFALGFRPSGKWALAAAFVPLAVSVTREAVITMARWADVAGVGELFC